MPMRLQFDTNEDKTTFMTFSINNIFTNFNLITTHKCTDGNNYNYLNK